MIWFSMPTNADSLRCVSVHSVKGGVGKSSISYLIARALAEHEPVLLVDLDLTGTSLADVIDLRAPAWDAPTDEAPEGTLPLARPPTRTMTWSQTRTAMRLRDQSDDPGVHHVPFLNDHFLWMVDDPDGRFELDEDVHPLALAWSLPDEDPLVDHLRIIPSSALPNDLERILPLVYDELHAAYLESRLEWLLNFILANTDVRTVVFDSPPSLPGLSRALLSMAMRLPDRESLAEEGGTPPRLDAAQVAWQALLLVSPDHQDLRAAERWLRGREPRELDRIWTVVNLTPPGEDEESFLTNARAVLARGDGGHPEPLGAIDVATSETLYSGELLSVDRQRVGRVAMLPRIPGWTLAQPGPQSPGIDPSLSEALERLLKAITP